MPVSPDRLSQEAVLIEHEYPTEDRPSWRLKFNQHRQNAKKRGLKSELTFEQYVREAAYAEIDHPGEIGKLPGQFQLGRVGDTGDYAKGNCRFIPVEQNARERIENGIAFEAGKKISEALMGVTASNSDWRERARQSNLGQRRPGVNANLAKPFVVFDPNGVEYRGTSMREFAEEHGLGRANMSAVCQGVYKQYKGWSGRYLKGEEE
jgi:hypothetical protein